MEFTVSNEVWFTLVSLEKKSSFSLKSDIPEVMSEHFVELVKCFGATIDKEKHEIKITSLLKNTDAFKKEIDNYVKKHRRHSPAISKLNDFFKKMKQDELFYFLPGMKDMTQKEHMMTCNELLSHMNSDVDLEFIQSKFSEVFDEFLDKYSLEGVSSEKKIKVGQGLKKNRICRFCNNKRQEHTSFNQEAHGISESLGNKTIILNEECDGCNKYFSETIERDIDTYLKTLSSLFKVKNKKNKVPKIKGKNFELSYNSKEDGPDFVIIHKPDENEAHSNTTFPENLHLKFYSKISMQNIYKALVKFSLSVIDSKYLPKFDATIDWISSDKFYPQLPKLAVLKSYKNFSTKPELIVYMRKDSDSSLPVAVGEFHFTFLTFVFIIPTFNKKECDFTSSEDYKCFWNFFKYYHIEKNWEYQDFSESEAKDFVFNMVFSQNNHSKVVKSDA